MGLCSSCGDPVIYQSDRCLRHHILRILAYHGFAGKLGTVNTRKREALVSRLKGRYSYTRIYGLAPETDVRWQDVKFARFRMADIESAFKKALAAVDRKALREYKGRPIDGEIKRPDHNGFIES